ncbi:MAG TPA: HD-GYP domain-containing protein [Candidatus Deferrimicrobiaceae bacterium]|jgi:HD-GYP domain-containing protein (c-di-GMP phosphodiesterase class II)
MLKKIGIEALKPGMVIEKMDRSWLEHPFLTNRKKITSQVHIERLREYGIHEVYINTEIGDDVAPEVAGPEPVVEIVDPDPLPPEQVPVPENLPEPLKEELPFDREIEVAKVVQQEAHTVVNDVLNDVRLGKNVEGGKAEKVVNRMIDSIFRNMDALSSLTRIKGYDEYTFVHSVNVCVLSLALGRQLDLDREEMQSLGVGALLHDAGKMRVPAEILHKPGKLTDAEFAEMKRHTIYSREILDLAADIPGEAKLVALQHHERMGGTGYPGGLAGEAISRSAQITAIADAYDAMTTTRVYSRPMTPPDGIRRIFELSKTDFNPIFAQRFIQCLGIYPVGTTVQLDSAEIGIVVSVNHEKVLRPKVLLVCRDDRRRLPVPVEVDLTEPSPSDPGKFRRTIVRPVDPAAYVIDPEMYLPKPAL